MGRKQSLLPWLPLPLWWWRRDPPPPWSPLRAHLWPCFLLQAWMVYPSPQSPPRSWSSSSSCSVFGPTPFFSRTGYQFDEKHSPNKTIFSQLFYHLKRWVACLGIEGSYYLPICLISSFHRAWYKLLYSDGDERQNMWTFIMSVVRSHNSIWIYWEY